MLRTGAITLAIEGVFIILSHIPAVQVWCCSKPISRPRSIDTCFDFYLAITLARRSSKWRRRAACGR
jgi:hypothetical protein